MPSSGSGRWTTSAGFWSSVWSFFDVQADRPYTRRAAPTRPCPAPVGSPGRELNYAARALATTGERPGGGGPIAVAARASSLSWDELRDLVARCRAGLVRLGRAVGRPRGGLPAQRPRGPGGLPGHGQPGRHLGVVPARVRGAERDRPVRPARSGASCWSPGATGTGAKRSTGTTRWPPSWTPCPPCDPWWTSTTDWDDLLREAGRAARSSRCPSTTRSTCCSPRAPPDRRRRSCTATAGSCSST